MKPTVTRHDLPLRMADFISLGEALDYAARGETGMNFYTRRGELGCALPYESLRTQAHALARKLLSLDLPKGSRMALIAETNTDFVRFFFACQYAGLVPVPLPISMNLGSHRAYVDHLRGMLIDCRAKIAMAPTEWLPFLQEATEWLGLRFVGQTSSFDDLPDTNVDLPAIEPEDLAYIQYTSGSTRFPRGVMITQQTILSNLTAIIRDGVKIRPGDRCVSWLPFYHDMGLVGLVLAPLACQISVDYLSARDFAMRPRIWLDRMTESKATISFGPSFGYDLVSRRLRPGEAQRFDLSHWRVAGVGAEMIRPEVIERFAARLKPAGFNRKAMVACYGMAECSLAVSFAPLDSGIAVDHIDGDGLSRSGVAIPSHWCSNPADTREQHISSYVDCGIALPGFEMEIRDSKGNELPERHTGVVHVRGASVMSGYFGDADATARVLSPDGWLNTGDIGYRVTDRLHLTGRQKDLIIINGRNIWPQDLEYIAEEQPEIRPNDALAFSIPGPDGDEQAVLVVQCRISEPKQRHDLIKRLKRLLYLELSIDCLVDLVPLHTLPRTSSGKLSRSWARLDYLGEHVGRYETGKKNPGHQQALPETDPQNKAV
ncbi:MAG: fatty acyl-AMP ligase [Gammaproteobacteria bacterium]|nr:fatty acyl-AMP ligase [Gammaproteobacteria bacterium]